MAVILVMNRLNNDNLNILIKEINPKFQLNNEIKDEYKEINLLCNETYIDKYLSYKNSYLLSNNSKGVLNQIRNNTELNLDFSKEQLRYNIIVDSKKNNNIINGPENKSKKGRKKKGNDNKEENNMNIILFLKANFK